MSVKIKRVYEPFIATDGYRILVDRLWPRGIKKETAHINEWMKEIAPSSELRKWFNHEPDKWKEFVTKYKAELQQSSALEQLTSVIEKHKVITLVYSAKDKQHNQAVALQKILMEDNSAI